MSGLKLIIVIQASEKKKNKTRLISPVVRGENKQTKTCLCISEAGNIEESSVFFLFVCFGFDCLLGGVLLFSFNKSGAQ